MSRALAIAGPVLAALFGAATMYTTLQPELIKEQAKREERDGQIFTQQHEQHELQAEQAQKDTVISRAMASDLKEAGAQIRDTKEGGFGWGIRKALFGGKGGREEESARREGSGE